MLKPSGMLFCVVGLIVPGVSMDRSAVVFRATHIVPLAPASYTCRTRIAPWAALFLLGLRDCEDEAKSIFQNIGNSNPNGIL
jgi:hypothetical protein